MEKLKINLFDLNGIINSPFGGQAFCKYTEYVDKLDHFDGITIFTDRYLTHPKVDSVNSKIKIAWLYEPREIISHIYNVYKTQDKFDYIFTHDQELLKLGSKYIMVPSTGCWIPEQSRKIHNKSKKISFIFSNKNMTYGHRFRQEIYNEFKNELDCFGHGAKFVNTKDLALNEYMYSVSIENCYTDNLFTEKLVDCFMTGTVPIYCGCTNVFNFFNKDGIIIFKTIEELRHILSYINEDTYNNMKSAIEENFNIASEYCQIEDWIYKNIFTNSKYKF